MIRFALSAVAAALLAACANTPPAAPAPAAPAAPAAAAPAAPAVPAIVQVPAGNKIALETVGVGELTYLCGPNKDIQGQFAWAIGGPQAVLNDRGGKPIGKYYGPPATWEAADGSKVTGTQLAVSPGSAGNIALQLNKANQATGTGAMTGVTFVQRLATQGGVAPATICNAAGVGKKEAVKFQADYIFWKAA